MKTMENKIITKDDGVKSSLNIFIIIIYINKIELKLVNV